MILLRLHRNSKEQNRALRRFCVLANYHLGEHTQTR
jgi:hypothetical protein